MGFPGGAALIIVVLLAVAALVRLVVIPWVDRQIDREFNWLAGDDE